MKQTALALALLALPVAAGAETPTSRPGESAVIAATCADLRDEVRAVRPECQPPRALPVLKPPRALIFADSPVSERPVRRIVELPWLIGVYN